MPKQSGQGESEQSSETTRRTIPITRTSKLIRKNMRLIPWRPGKYFAKDATVSYLSCECVEWRYGDAQLTQKLAERKCQDDVCVPIEVLKQLFDSPVRWKAVREECRDKFPELSVIAEGVGYCILEV